MKLRRILRPLRKWWHLHRCAKCRDLLSGKIQTWEWWDFEHPLTLEK